MTSTRFIVVVAILMVASVAISVVVNGIIPSVIHEQIGTAAVGLGCGYLVAMIGGRIAFPREDAKH